MPKFSIIIPVFNVSPYLRECLDSVLAQTFTDWEAICVDDGSSDGSENVLDEYASRDSRIKVVHKENEGVSIARNVGLKLASGDYVTFLDSDDCYADKWLENAECLILRSASDLVRMRLTRFDECHDDRDILDNAGSNLVSGNDIVEWGWRELMHEGWAVLLFVRKDILTSHADVQFPEGMKMEEDNIFCLRLLKYVQTICQGSYAGYWYRQTPTSVVHKPLVAEYCTRFYRELDQLWKDWQLRNLTKQEFVTIRRQIAYGVNVDLDWFYTSNNRPVFKGALRQYVEIARLLMHGAMDVSAYSRTGKVRFFLFLCTISFVGYRAYDVYRLISKTRGQCIER